MRDLIKNEVAFLTELWVSIGACVVIVASSKAGCLTATPGRAGSWSPHSSALPAASSAFLASQLHPHERKAWQLLPWCQEMGAWEELSHGDSEHTSPSCVFLYLQAQVHKHITALPGVRRITHGTQALNPAELGLLTLILVKEVPLPSRFMVCFGQFHFASGRKIDRSYLMSAESSAASLLLTQVSGAGAVPHAMTTHGWHNGPGSWCSVTAGHLGTSTASRVLSGLLGQHWWAAKQTHTKGAALCRCRPGDGAAWLLQDSTEMGGEILSSYVWAVFPNESHVSQLHRCTESSTTLMMPRAPIFGSWTAPVSSTSQFTNLSFCDWLTTFLNTDLIYCSVLSVLNLSVPALGVPK